MTPDTAVAHSQHATVNEKNSEARSGSTVASDPGSKTDNISLFGSRARLMRTYTRWKLVVHVCECKDTKKEAENKVALH